MKSFNKPRVVFGMVECVSIPAFGVDKVIAKIDTGAYTGALHCEEVKLVKTAKGEKILHYRPLGKDYPIQKTTQFKRVQVTSASGHKSRRFAVPITMYIQGQEYAGYIGLTSRKDLRRQVLIGRRFLNEHNILVDVKKNSEDITDAEMM